MKILPILFSIYLLALSLVPCTDSSVSMEEEIAHMELASHADADHHEHEDECPPFCSCNCCGLTIAFLSTGLELMKVPFNYESFLITLYQSSISSFYHSFWQPPKIDLIY